MAVPKSRRERVGPEGTDKQRSDALRRGKLHVVASDVTIEKPGEPMDWAEGNNPVLDGEASTRRQCAADRCQERRALAVARGVRHHTTR